MEAAGQQQKLGTGTGRSDKAAEVAEPQVQKPLDNFGSNESASPCHENQILLPDDAAIISLVIHFCSNAYRAWLADLL
jgi:hypothetical protein